MTLKEFKDNYLHGVYYLKGARTGKILWKSWVNKSTTKYDDAIVVSVWSDIRVIDSPFGDYARPIMGIYLLGF